MTDLLRSRDVWCCDDRACGRLLQHDGETRPRCPSCGGTMSQASDRQARLAAAGVRRITGRSAHS